MGAPRPAPLRPRPELLVPDPPPTEGGGGTTLFANNVPVGVPFPPAVCPVPPPAAVSTGGGATTLAKPTVVAVEDAAERVPVPPVTPAVGGGAITLLPSDVPIPLRLPRELPPGAFAATLGGGGTTFAGREEDDDVPPVEPFVFTVGGGGTTSDAPKIFPIKLLRTDPLPVCGGGGTTVLVGSGAFPLASRCRSRDISVEGGGATTDGAGRLSMGSRR
jgi:hypothetical protein